MSAPIRIASSRQAASLTPDQRDNLSSTPGGNNLFGTTPGGTRIMYSRDQLLSLASSPLSQTSAFGKQSSIPAEISRSPEKSSYSLGKSPRATSNFSGLATGNRTSNTSNPLPSSSTAGSGSGSNPTIVANGFNKIGRERSGSNGRSPGGVGNAFNFNGPISPTKMSALSAQLKGTSVNGSSNSIQTNQQQQQQAPSSDTDGSSPSGKHGDEQFEMEL